MTQKRYTEIPKKQKCINKEEPYIGGAEDIVDDALGKTQNQVNQDAEETKKGLAETEPVED
jgi:hypothetical protein